MPDPADVQASQSLESHADWVPDASTIQQGIEKAEREEAERERELESPGAVGERKRSRNAFGDLEAAQAEALLRSEFAAQLNKLNGDPARSLSRAEDVRPMGEDAAAVLENGERAVLESSVPVKTRDDKGALRLVDVRLETKGDRLETANALVDVGVGGSAAGPITVGDEGLSIVQEGARSASSTSRFGEQNVFQFEAFVDTDTVISPTATGLEVSHLLRSVQSPEDFAYDFDLPPGAELRGFAGGAEIVRDGKRIALVPTPTAVDAQGTDVPVNAVVEGGSLRLETGHRSGDYAYPILVDPILDVWNWIGGYGYDGLTNGAWLWSGAAGWIWPGTGAPCAYTCWGRGLYLTAPSNNYPANTYTQWVYSAPPNAYVQDVNLAIFVRDEHINCLSPPYNQPHDYAGYVTSAGVWQPWANNPYMNGSEQLHLLLAGWGQAYVWGVGTGPGVNIPCWRDFYVGVAGVWLDDWANPYISSVGGMPSGWISTSSQMNPQAIAHDDGLGVQFVTVAQSGKGVIDQDAVGCTGVYASRCPTVRNSPFDFTALSLGEGIRTLSISATDPTGKGSGSWQHQTMVDITKPEVTLSGQLAQATNEGGTQERPPGEGDELSLPVYNLNISTTDGNPAGEPKDKRSGVKDIKIFLDDDEVEVPWSAQGCGGPNYSCPMNKTYSLVLTDVEAGEHTLKVRVVDHAGNYRDRNIEFEYFPATGMKDEYVMHHFPLSDGSGEEEGEGAPSDSPELAVNVMNGNLVYREKDVDVEGSAPVDIEVERYYNSMLPESKDTGWGDGWTVADVPDLTPRDSGSPLAAIATLGGEPGVNEHGFSLWLDMPDPGGAQEGYALEFERVLAGVYDVSLSRWDEGDETVLASEPGFAFAADDSLALVDEGSTVSAWADAGSGFALLISADDSTFEEGGAGLEGVGDDVRLTDFKAGPLDSPSGNIADELAALPVTEAFDGGEASLGRFQSDWLALGWATGESPKGADTAAGWGPVDAFPAASGAYLDSNISGHDGIFDEAEMVDETGAVEPGVELPAEAGQEAFDPELQATVKKKSTGGYLLTDDTGESMTSTAFNEAGRAEALVTESDVKVDFGYQGGELSRIDVEDPGSAGNPTDAPEEAEEEPQMTNPTPVFSSAFGSNGTGNGQLDTPGDLVVDSQGHIWVADTQNKRVQEFAPDGEFLSKFGSPGSGPGQFNAPTGIAVDPGGDIWVTDAANDRVQKFSPEGEFIAGFDSTSAGPPSEGLVASYSFDEGEGSVAHDDSGGENDAAIEGAEWTAGKYGSALRFDAGAENLLTVAADEALEVEDFTLEAWVRPGESLEWAPVATNSHSAGYGYGLYAGGELAGKPEGLITLQQKWFAAYAYDNQALPLEAWTHLALTSDTEDLRLYVDGELADTREGEDVLAGAGPLLIGGDELTEGFYDGKIDEVRLYDRALGQEEIEEDMAGGAGSGSSGPEGIAIDGDGDIWVTDRDNGRVQVFSPEGELVRAVGSPGSGEGELGEPTGIDVGPEGNVWVADWQNQRVAVFDREGEFLLQFGSEGAGDGEFDRPTAVDVDERGNVWVADQENARIQRFDIEGDYVDKFGSPGSGEGQLDLARPLGIHATEAGQVLVSDNLNDRVQRWNQHEAEPGESEALPDDDPTVDVEVSDGLVTSVEGEEAGEHSYEHEGDDLIAHEGPEGATEYEYDGEGRMTKVTLANETVGEISYQSEGRVDSVTIDPAGEEEQARTTEFNYSDDPRRTTVLPPGDPHIVYDIGNDGSVFKWWNTQEPPDLDLSGSLYDNKEKDGKLFAGDHLLEAEAYSSEGVASIEVIADGETLVDEKHCEQDKETEGLECVSPSPYLEWVMETGSNPPGHMWVEAIATDRLGESTSERFWVDVPETPPLAPGTPVPPKFSQIAKFRADYGLEINFPVEDETELNERIFDLITAWWNPQTPAGEVARASYERWGVPLRPADVAELEYREWFLETNGRILDSWFEEADPTNYAGYVIDHQAGGVFRIGFTDNQTSGLVVLEGALPLVASARLDVFSMQPKYSLSDLVEVEDLLVENLATDPALDNAVSDIQLAVEQNSVEVLTQNVPAAEEAAAAILGDTGSVIFEYMPTLAQATDGRTRANGRMRAGDRIYNTAGEGCTAGFGTYKKGRKLPNGKVPRVKFLLTAGHCSDEQEEVFWRTKGSSSPVGYVEIDPWTGGPNFGLDAEAIRLKGKKVVPRTIYTGTERPWGVRPAKQAFVGDLLYYSGASAGNPNPRGRVVGRSKGAVKRPNGRRVGGYWVEFNRGIFDGDSGSPVFKNDGSAIGLAVGTWENPEGRFLTLVVPLLHPPNMRKGFLPGILHHASMRPMFMSTGPSP